MKFKRPLVLLLVLALAMSAVTGGTIAWFTDEVTNSGNKITSGNLDIVLEYKNALDDQWTEVKNGSAPLFDPSILWEPGYTAYKYFRISNAGNLALKYRLHLNVDPSTEAQEYNLADVIDVYMLDGSQEISRAAIASKTPVGTLANLSVENDGAAHGILLPKNATATPNTEEKVETTGVFCIALKMQESAGNNYQNLSVGNGFSLVLEATQYAYEKDSFDTNDYDANVGLTSNVDSVADLKQALSEGGTVTLIDDIEVTETIAVPAGASVTLNLNGNSITGKMTKNENDAILQNNGTLKIVGGTLENTTTNGAAVINNAGELVLAGTAIEGAPIGEDSYPAYAVYTSGKLMVEQGTKITSDRGAISMSAGADVVINGGNIKVTDALGTRGLTAHVIYAYGSNSKLTINDGNFSMDYKAAGGTGASVICPAGATINVYGGNFSYAGENGNQSGIFQNYMGYGAPVNVYGGTYNDNTVTKQNNIASGYKAVESNNAWVVVPADTAEANDAESLNTALSNGGDVILTYDVTYNAPIRKDAKINLNGNTFEATSAINLLDNADLTMTGGNYKVNVGSGYIDVRPSTAEGSTVVFDGVNFSSKYLNKTFGTSTDRLNSVVEVCATVADANTNILFRNCTFDNAKVFFEGLSGKIGSFEATFENCTFYALTSSAPIEVQNYIKGTITVKDCTFNLECTSSVASAISVSPSSSTAVTLKCEGTNVLNAKAATPYTYDPTKGETEAHNVKVNGTPANIKNIFAYDNTTVVGEDTWVVTGIGKK